MLFLGAASMKLEQCSQELMTLITGSKVLKVAGHSDAQVTKFETALYHTQSKA